MCDWLIATFFCTANKINPKAEQAKVASGIRLCGYLTLQYSCESGNNSGTLEC